MDIRRTKDFNLYFKKSSYSCRHQKLSYSEERMKEDGLNSLKYEVVKREEQPLFTQVTVNVDPNAV